MCFKVPEKKMRNDADQFLDCICFLVQEYWPFLKEWVQSSLLCPFKSPDAGGLGHGGVCKGSLCKQVPSHVPQSTSSVLIAAGEQSQVNPLARW